MGRNTFCQGFEYGENDNGYWTYERMVLQLEDYTDILKTIHPGICFFYLIIPSGMTEEEKIG